MSGMETTVTFFTRGIHLIKPAVSVRHLGVKCNPLAELHRKYRRFCVCKIIVTFSIVNDEVGAMFKTTITGSSRKMELMWEMLHYGVFSKGDRRPALTW